VIGGANMRPQIASLAAARQFDCHAGRLLDLTERGAVNLSNVEVLVPGRSGPDAGHGFLPAIRRVLAMLPTNRQTLFVLSHDVLKHRALERDSTMKQPKLVEVKPARSPGHNVEQTGLSRGAGIKDGFAARLLERERFERVLVFTRTRRGAERLAHNPRSTRSQCVKPGFHADRTQSQREAALRDFRDGRTRVLVATDIAGARIGRRQRFRTLLITTCPPRPKIMCIASVAPAVPRNEGQAFTIVAPVDELSMRAIERLTATDSEARGAAPRLGGAAPQTNTNTTASPCAMSRAGPAAQFSIHFGREERDEPESNQNLNKGVEPNYPPGGIYGRETNFAAGDRVEQMCVTCGEERGHIGRFRHQEGPQSLG